MTERKNEVGFQKELVWTEKELREFNVKNNAPFGKDFAEGNENIILSKNIHLSPEDRKTHKNGHVMVIGGAGSGKSYNIILPNLMRSYGSYIVTDPDGRLLEASRKKLEQEGYDIKVLDFEHPVNSDHYNPIQYIHSTEDTINLVNCILDNKNVDFGRMTDPFFNKTEAAFLTAIILYVRNFLPETEQTMHHVSEIITILVRNPDQLDKMFAEVKEFNINDESLSYYETVKLASAKTRLAAFVNASLYVSGFRNKENDLSISDSLNLALICNRNTAIFLTGYRTARAQAILVPMLIEQAFTETMLQRAMDYEKNYYEMNFLTMLLDDFTGLGHISQLEILISTSRKYRIGVIMAAQNIAKIRKIYGENTSTIFDACATKVYMPESTNLNNSKYILRKLCISESDADKESDNEKAGVTENLTDRDSMQISHGECVVHICGMPACVDKKYTNDATRN